MTTHSSILAWRIPCTEESGGLQSVGSQMSRTQLSEKTYFFHNTQNDTEGEKKVIPPII